MAGPSAADVRSVFSLPSTPGPSQPKAPAAPERARKPEGMSRELYSLIGQSAPTLVAQLAKPRLKQKPNLGGGGRVKWEWRSFQNQARSDGLRLSHWVKAGTPSDGEYPFAKYNVQNPTYTYTQDEYTKFLTDKEWTKEETDYLFDLVRQYDQRFYVVADRYEYPGGPPRSMEDLKDRYFSVCRKLVRDRPWPGDEATKSQILSSFSFDKEREVMRKKYLESLESRTQEEIAEEEALFTELKRLEQNERRFKKERDELLRTVLGIESGLPDVQADEEVVSGAPQLESISTTTTKKTKKKGVTEPDTPMSAGPSASNATVSLAPPVPKKQSAKSAAYDALHCIHRTEVPQLTTATATKAAHQPVYLRSYKLPAPKSANAHKIAQVLGELGVSSTRLVMPTKDNCQKLEALLEAATALVETKKQVDKIDQEIRLAQERLGQGSAEGDADGEAEDDTMDVDEPAEEGGRSQSVVSARSVRSSRGRKQS
ncbi:SWR1-complex protein [Phanerochaete sordida]|uniref:SWR1-complex protein 4 n=1 Tax=Phanerochaete sordida TaxID=48140 RepID=A0A9P3FY21_9APHY|nr:SWR1-complex protein [Phanerochaete sordida]